MREFVVDTFGTVVFFTVVAALTELFIAGMDPAQVLMARVISIPVMVLTGRPYGMWRDWIFTRFAPRGRFVNTAVDILAFLTFQVPVYVTTLLVSGASIGEIQVAVSAAIVFMVLLSRPFGLFLEALRKWTAPSPL
jgi:hypothetical protein